MPVTAREPWVKIKLGLRRSDKLAALPSDTARLGWHYVLLEAKVQRRLGVFVSRAHFIDVMGRFGRYLPEYLARGLAHEAPKLCDRCKSKYPDATAGEIVVHDYRIEQRDPTNADRQQEWRERNGERNAEPNDEVTQDVTPTVTPHSRARGTTVTVTERERTRTSPTLSEAAPPDVSRKNGKANGNGGRPVFLTAEQLAAWSTFTDDCWSQFKLAWLARGFRHPPFGDPDDDPGTSQRSRLYAIAQACPTWIAQWVTEAPGKSAHDVIAYIFDKRAEMAADAGIEEAETAAETAERNRDRRPLRRLGEVMPEALDDYGF